MKPHSDPDGPPPVGRLDLGRSDAYGRSFADVYDRWYDGVTDADATARFVAARSAGRTIVELGVGSGRLAVPMAALGCTVVGLDASAPMLRRVPRPPDQPPGSGLHLVRADMRALPFGRPVGAVLIAFNTLFNLSSHSEQSALLVELATLVTDGVLIIEALDVTALLAGPLESIGFRNGDDDGVVVTATQLDRDDQLLTGQHLEISDEGISVRPWRLRWLTPAQLDDMCAAVGLRLVERHGSWSEDPVAESGGTRISVYRRA